MVQDENGKLEIDTHDIRLTISPLEVFKIQRSIEKLLQHGQILQQSDSNLIKIEFNDLQYAKYFVTELLKIGFGYQHMPQQPKKIEPILHDPEAENIYIVELTQIEWKALQRYKQSPSKEEISATLSIESKVGKKNNRLKITENNWVVSMLNTGGIIFGGPHSKLIVEGLLPNPISKELELFIGEYHIMESNSLEQTGFLCPPGLTNVRGKSVIIMSEYKRYGVNLEKEKQSDEDEKKKLKNTKLNQYANCSSRGWIVSRENVINMIDNIKDEKKNYDDKGNYKDFQYGGNWRYWPLSQFWSSGTAHNCTTWCIEKLQVAKVGINIKPTDVIKAVPEKHISAIGEKYDEIAERLKDQTCKIL